MSKKLSPLEALERIRSHNYHEHNKRECLSIIETALKEKEQQDSVLKILKEVIQFARTLPHIEPDKDNGFDVMSCVGINIQRNIENRERELLRKWVLETCFPKELKALELIIEKPVVALVDYKYTYEEWLELVDEREKDLFRNKEEYDLLKEVLL